MPNKQKIEIGSIVPLYDRMIIYRKGAQAFKDGSNNTDTGLCGYLSSVCELSKLPGLTSIRMRLNFPELYQQKPGINFIYFKLRWNIFHSEINLLWWWKPGKRKPRQIAMQKAYEISYVKYMNSK